MARKLHHLTIRRGPRTLASGVIDVDHSQGHDIAAAAIQLLEQAGQPPSLVGTRAEIRDATGRKWIREVALR